MLLPDPDGPMTAVNVPRGNSAVTASSARTAALPDPYTFDTESRRTAYGEGTEGTVCGLDGAFFVLMPFDARFGGRANRYPAPPDLRYSWL
ncbi:hypothetical protein GCM10020369_83530 [Cryptosporangium minutisporangium]|uniref:Uncharacterized protein n=1 Tax=Cryptosporangium minutisporangium TaxID=113569 RepID=A0ABP6TCS4_9ACTN